MVQRRVSDQPNYSWAGLEINNQTVAANTKVILGSFTLSTDFDETVTRTRGAICVRSDQLIAVENYAGVIGMIVVSEDAFATGIGAIPGPSSDSSNDGWFFWQVLSGVFDLAGGNGGGNLHPLDSKGQRIVRSGSRIVVVVEGGQTAGAVGFNISGYLRILGRFRS